VKFGGSPTDLSNKIVVPTDVHRQQLTPWWNRLQRDLGG
jgi:filamentous hemagglutinin